VTAPPFVGAAYPGIGLGRLVAGRGCFLDDVRLPQVLHAAFVRSPHAAARVRRLDVGPARRAPGVVGAFDYRAISPHLRAPIPAILPHPEMKAVIAPPLADGIVRYVGEPVAVVVAASRYAAEDAAEAVVVEYQPTAAVSDLDRAVGAETPFVHPEFGTNVALRIRLERGDALAALHSAPVVVQETLRMGRTAAQPMETRGIVASYDPARGLSVWCSTQHPFNLKRALVRVLGVPERLVDVVAPDVGGGFGAKVMFYPEEFVIPLIAMQLRRAVKWVEDRRESFLATSHQAEQVHHVQLGVRADGTILALVDRFLHDAGAYTPYGTGTVFNTAMTLPGPYRVARCLIEADVVYTNRVPTTPYRGSGRPQACFVINRMLDRAAHRIGLDPVEIRRRNLIPAAELPYDTGLVDRGGLPVRYDTGDYPAALERVVQLARYDEVRERQASLRSRGRYVGFGVACYVENTAQRAYEGAKIDVDTTGAIVVATGAASQGQGHETTLAQVAADVLGVRPTDVQVVGGDTKALPYGVGTFGSRTAVTAGNAVRAAAEAVRGKALRLAAHLLEASAGDLTCAGGRVSVRGAPDRSVSLAEIARAADPMRGNLPTALDPGLTATSYYRAETTWGGGAHAAVVEVDPETGSVHVLDYWAVHDCGAAINPAIVDGQVRGGVAQGIGGALYEAIVYDAGGQLLTTTFMDFLLPTAPAVPSIVVEHLRAALPDNPLGVKGVGEAGIIPAAAVIIAAIEDALRPFAVSLRSAPLGPPQIVQAVTTQDR